MSSTLAHPTSRETSVKESALRRWIRAHVVAADPAPELGRLDLLDAARPVMTLDPALYGRH